MKLHSIDPNILLSQATKGVETKGAKKDDPEALRKTCQEFEAVFIQAMFKGMRGTIPQGGLFEKNSGQQMFEDMMDVEVAREASSQGKFGIAETLVRQLLDQPGAVKSGNKDK